MQAINSKGVCLIIGAGDGLGGAIARAFSRDGHPVCITRRVRNLDQLEVLAGEIRDQGGIAHSFGVDARTEADMIALFNDIEARIGPLEVVVFNIGANVRFGLVETTARVFTKVWEMACFAGFLAGREAARVMARAAADRFCSPERPPRCADAKDSRPLRPPRPDCARLRRVLRASWRRRAFTWLMLWWMAPSTASSLAPIEPM